MKALLYCALLLPAFATLSARAGALDPRLIEIVAAKDNTFRVLHEKSPVIRAKPGELLRLRITSQRGSEQARDAATLSLLIRALRDQGWDLRLYVGTKHYYVRVPETPAVHLVHSIVKCARLLQA